MAKETKQERERRLTREQHLRYRERQLLATLLGAPAQSLLPEPRPSLLKKMWNAGSRVWGIIGGVSVLVGLIGVVTFLPQMSAKPFDTADVAHPPETLVTIWNDSFYPLDDVRYLCLQVRGVTRQAGDYIGENIITPNDSQIGRLGAGDPKTISCAAIGSVMDQSRIQTVDFMVVVFFRPAFIPNFSQIDFGPIHMSYTKRNFRFTAMRGPDGHIYTTPQPGIQTPELDQRWGTQWDQFKK
jgi:hypothetical protein